MAAGPAGERARWPAESSGVRMIAIDSVGVESRMTTDYDVNVTLRRAGILILEGLVGPSEPGERRLWLRGVPLEAARGGGHALPRGGHGVPTGLKGGVRLQVVVRKREVRCFHARPGGASWP